MVRKSWLVMALLAGLAACAKPVPTDEGIWVRDGRAWTRLARVPADSLKSPVTTDLNALKAVARIGGDDEIRVAFSGVKPEKVVGYRRSGAGWEAFSVASAPAEGRDNAWLLTLPKPAPRGLVILQVDRTRAVGVLNGPEVAYFFTLGKALQGAGKLEAARGAFEDAIDTDGKHAPSKNELARVLAAGKTDLGKARSLANEAISLAAGDEEKALYFDTLGEVYFVDGDVDKGMESIDRAIALDLKNPAFHTHLTALIGKAQKEPPEVILKRFYAALAAGQQADAAELSLDFDVQRLKDADQLSAVLNRINDGGPFTEVVIENEVKHGKITHFKYQLVARDGGRRTEDIKLHFQKNQWKVGLE